MSSAEFSTTIVKMSKSLKPFAVRLTKDIEEANDLLQETVMKAFIHREKFSEGTNLKAWLYTIMRNTFITNYQRLIRKNTFIDTTDNLHYINSTDSLTENRAYSSFAMADITTAIDSLEDVYQTPFKMYYNGFKYHEIAVKLDIPIGTVKNRIHIARKFLKEKLSIYSNLTAN